MNFLYLIVGITFGAILQDMFVDAWVWLTFIAVGSLALYSVWQSITDINEKPEDPPFLGGQDP